jgi:hypothetical protein
MKPPHYSLSVADECLKYLHATAISSSHLGHMKPDPSNKTADAIVGKKLVDNADQCPRVAGVSQMPDSEVQGRGTVRKLVQDPYCLSYVFADLPDDGSNVAITCPVFGHIFYASVSERL